MTAQYNQIVEEYNLSVSRLNEAINGHDPVAVAKARQAVLTIKTRLKMHKDILDKANEELAAIQAKK